MLELRVEDYPSTRPAPVDRGTGDDAIALAAVTALLCVAALISALVCIAADLKDNRTGVYVFKPLTMLFVLAVAVSSGNPDDRFYHYALLAGLTFSLAGDVLLMLPSDRFVEGLVSFLIAHVCYIAGLSAGIGVGGPLAALGPFLVVAGLALYLILPGAGSLRIPVIGYVTVIAMMGWQALSRFWALNDAASTLALAGATLFLFSDFMLAINRFRKPLVASPVFVLGSYFPAQLLIALSIGA